VALGVLVVSILIAGGPLIKLFRQKTRGAAAKAQFMELINDELGLLAALAGTLFVMMGVTIADPLAAMVVATIIAINAVGLFRENLSFLLGRAPSPEFMARLEAAARSVPGVMGIHYLHAEYIGPAVIHGDIHIQVEPTLTVVEGHRIAKKVDLTLEPLMGNGI